MPKANKSIHAYFRRAKRIAMINKKLFIFLVLLLGALSITMGWFIGKSIC